MIVAGLSADKAFDMSVGYLAVGFVCTIASWYLITIVGRRRIYNCGLATLSVLMFLIALLDCAPNYSSRPGVIWAQSTIMVIWNGIYDLSIGPVCFVIICEASATRVRGKTIAVATAVQALMGIVMTVAIPYMINPDEANMRGKLGFFFGTSSLPIDEINKKPHLKTRVEANQGTGGLSCISFVWAWFRVPETGGRSYEELDLMFERKVRTREFKKYEIL